MREKALLAKKKELEAAKRLERIIACDRETQFICDKCGKITDKKFQVTHELLHAFGDK